MGNVKSAQDILELLRRVGSKVKDPAGDAGSSISNWYEELNPDLKKTVMRGTLGAGAGALLTGGIAAMTPHDPERKRPVLTPALTGALMGGIGAAGLPVGWKMMTGGIKLPGERKKPLLDRGTDAVMNPMLHNLGTTAGGVYAAKKYGPGVLDAYKSVAGPAMSKANLIARLKAVPLGARFGIPTAILAGMLVDRTIKGRS